MEILLQIKLNNCEPENIKFLRVLPFYRRSDHVVYKKHEREDYVRLCLVDELANGALHSSQNQQQQQSKH